MKMIRKVGLMVAVGIMVGQFVIGAIAPTDSLANGRGFQQGYFYNMSAGGVTHYNVLESGLPESSVGTDKQKFLEFVQTRLLNSSQAGPCPGNGCDYAGASYIIQTMRGGANGWHYNFPAGRGPDVDDWVAKVRNPDIGLRWGYEGGASGTLTSARFRTNGVRDVAQVSGDTSGKTLSFYSISTGKVYYVLRESCANPLGDYPGLPDPAANWRVSGNSTIQVGATPNQAAGRNGTVTAKPGDRINWYHDLTNNGPDNMDKTVSWSIDKTGFSNGWNGISAPAGSNSGTNGSIFVKVYASQGNAYSLYDITQDDVGNTVCERIRWTPQSSSNGATAASGYACASVPYSYTLTPTVATDRSGIVEAPASVNVTPHVTNSGPTKSRSTQWQLTRIDVVSGKTISKPSGGQSAAAQLPCTFFAGTGSVCKILQKGNSVFYPNGSITGDALNAAAEQINDLPVGSKICFAMSVQPVSSGSTNWSHSAPTCLIVAKKPKVQVLGGDLVVGRPTVYNAGKVSQVVTSASYSGTTSKYYGSWSEYAIIPSGNVRGMASGAMYVDGANSSDLCTLSVLTISNDTGSGCQASSVGQYAIGSTAPNIASRFTANSNIAGASVDLNSLASAHVYTATSPNLSISSSQPVVKGKWVVINDPRATVTITSNINYIPANLAGLGDIPQVVIIAKNIIIAPTVTNVDAWLIAAGTGNEGYINTCSSIAAGSPAGITSNTCNQQLTVNGPVLANKLYMYRTAGSGVGAARGDPAEVFNLRADSYLWASYYSSSNGRLPTVSTKDLPPRF